MKVCLVAMTPDYSRREKQHSLAPYVLKRYSDVHLGRTGVDIRVLDYNSDCAARCYRGRGARSERPDLVGFSCYIWNYADFLRVAGMLKAVEPGILIVAGGPMFADDGESVMLESPALDLVCHETMYGEITFIHLIRALLDRSPLAGVPGIMYRTPSSGIMITDRSDEVPDRSAVVSPILSGDLVLDGEGGSFVTIETSPGCPFDCAYCD